MDPGLDFEFSKWFLDEFWIHKVDLKDSIDFGSTKYILASFWIHLMGLKDFMDPRSEC